MLSLASLIGFGLVMLVVSFSLSILLGGALMLADFRPGALGPWLERRAATLVVVLPPVIGLMVASIIAATKLSAFATGGDHCLDHGHHYHLCPIHGAEWLDATWAVSVIALFLGYFLFRTGKAVLALVIAQRSATRLRRMGSPVGGLKRTYIVPSPKQFAFTIGLFPPIVIVSQTAWDSLKSEEKVAVLAHESAHITNGDLWKRMALALASCFGAPFLSRRVMGIWDFGSERICDNAAVAAVGKPSIVAEAILSLTRSRAVGQVPAMAFFAATTNINQRVASLFESRSEVDRPASRRLIISFLTGAGIATLGCVAHAESLHHVLETLLGGFWTKS